MEINWIDATKIFGGTALIIWCSRFLFAHIRWRLFLKRLPDWLQVVSEEGEDRFVPLGDMPDDWWASECTQQLMNVGYAPREIKDLGTMAVDAAKDLARASGVMEYIE